MGKLKKKSILKHQIPGISAWRWRILSDESVNYLYSEKEGIIHDKTCEKARLIPDRELKYSRDYIIDLCECKRCRLAAYLRFGQKIVISTMITGSK